MREQSLMVHGQKNPHQGLLQQHGGDKALPQLHAGKARASLLLQHGQSAARGACVEEQSHVC